MVEPGRPEVAGPAHRRAGPVARALDACRAAGPHLLRLVPRREPRSIDALTRLGDRGLLARRAAHAFVPGAPPRALLLLDLDGFKRVNDTLGHLAGDRVLQAVARRITDTLRPGDLAVRLGGDEFAVLTAPLRGDDPDAEAAAVAERLLAALAPPVPVDDLHLPVGASLGVAVHDADGTGFEEMLRAADQAMYAAKAAAAGGVSAGRWRRVVHPGWGTVEGPDLVADLRAGLAAGQLQLHHQPQVAWDGTVTGFEALLRWQHPTLGMLSPRQFLPVAERAGMLGRITLHTLEQALAAHPVLAGEDPDLTISVNVPARDLLGETFVPALDRLLRRSAVPPRCITLEISEPSPFPVPTVVHLFAGLTALGVGISIHEFGAGQSSLTALSQYPGLREIKVDPTLVRQVPEDEGVARLVRAIVNAAHGFEVEVVAEGVEDAATVSKLRELDCDRLQGFWLSPPLPLAEVPAWRRRWRHESELRLAL